MAKWYWCWREPLRALALLAPPPQAGTGNTPAMLPLYRLSFHFPGFIAIPRIIPLPADLLEVGRHPGIKMYPLSQPPLYPKVGQGWQIGKGDMIDY